MFGRMPKLPVELKPALEREERVLAWARAGDAAAVIVTNRGLWLPMSTLLRWHEIHKAAWADGTLTVTGSSLAAGVDYAVASDAPPVSVRLAEPGKVPRRVQERVSASVAYTSLYPVPGGGSARVVARRVSGRDGLNWSVRFEGVAAQNQDDPVVRAAVDEFVASAKSSIAVID